MKNLKIFLLVCLTFLLANSAFSQGKFLGKVIEVVDGKTVVIELPAGKVTAVLQYVEIPEPDQPFSKEVKNHLKALTFGKMVEFKPLRVTPKNTVGMLTLEGVDISNQMIRDGAAWYALPEKTGQSDFESRTYQDNEKQARAEKRGIWSVENLRPAWEVRAEADEKRRQQENISKEERSTLEQFGAVTKPQKTVARRSLNSESEIWSQDSEKLPQNVTQVGGLLLAYDSKIMVGFAATPLFKLEFAENDGSQALGIGVGYFYVNSETKGRRGKYLVGIESVSRDFQFLKQNQMIVTADGERLNLGKPRRRARKNDFGVKEIMLYEINRSAIEKIANAQNIEVKVGNFQSKIPDAIQNLLQNLLDASK